MPSTLLAKTIRLPFPDQLGSVLTAPRNCVGVTFIRPLPFGLTMMLAPALFARTKVIFVPLGEKAGLRSLREPVSCVMFVAVDPPAGWTKMSDMPSLGSIPA